MNELAAVLRWVGAITAMAGFGFVLIGALVAGVDPLWALLRAAATVTAFLIAYSLLCRILIPLAAAIGTPANEGAQSQERV